MVEGTKAYGSGRRQTDSLKVPASAVPTGYKASNREPRHAPDPATGKAIIAFLQRPTLYSRRLNSNNRFLSES